MANQSKVDLLVPGLMVGSWFLGVIVAFGHHVYYNSLDGSSTDVYQSIFGFRFSRQQLTMALGTSFSFVSRAFLIFATSVAYVQVFWRAARHLVKQNTLADLDAMFSGPSDLLALRKGSVWQKHPLLVLVALTSWLLPIPFVIPPSTLSVVLVAENSSAMRDVPNVDFTSFNYVAGVPFTATTAEAFEYLYGGPSVAVEKVAVAVAAQGAILPIAPPAENSSWSLDFYGPSLSCGAMEDSLRSQVEPNIVQFFNQSGQPSIYLCWNPNDDIYFKDEIVYHINDTVPLPYPDAAFPDTPGFFKGTIQGPFTPIYFALFPSLAQGSSPYYLSQASSPYLSQGCSPFHSEGCSPSQNASYFQCDLHNASYHVNFNYRAGFQNIAFKIDRLEAVSNVFQMFGPANDLGLDFVSKFINCDRLEEYEPLENAPCVFDTGLLRRLSYTGVLDGFRNLMVGSVALSPDQVSAVDTSIFTTSLIDTPELEYLLQYVKSPLKRASLQNQYRLNKTSQGAALLNIKEMPPRSSLPRAIEELFSNFTISLMSSDLLQSNLSSPFRPPPVNVTFTTLNSVYSYSPTSLWIAYGAAILASSLSLVVGIMAILPNSASYNSDFSTILRAAHGIMLSSPVQLQDINGASPLPKYLETAKVSWLIPGDDEGTMHPTSLRENLVNENEGGPDRNALSVASENTAGIEADVVYNNNAAAVPMGRENRVQEMPRG
ncbi:hypothetical protein F5Y03DRAFT_362063 [Xylaria venustula]|nr:hypothetical protein F5Y03DRAFT_362063 [Xylaria venustula]